VIAASLPEDVHDVQRTIESLGALTDDVIVVTGPPEGSLIDLPESFQEILGDEVTRLLAPFSGRKISYDVGLAFQVGLEQATGDFRLLLQAGEVLQDPAPAGKLIEKMAREKISIGFFSHDVAGMEPMTRFRVIARNHEAPSELGDFVGPYPDVSRLQGLVKLCGILTEDVRTRAVLAEPVSRLRFLSFMLLKHGGRSRYLYHLAAELLSLGHSDLAEPLLERFLAGSDWCYERALAHVKLGQIMEEWSEAANARAIAHHALATRIYPGLPEAHIGMGRVLEYAEDSFTVIQHVERGLKAASETMNILPITTTERRFHPNFLYARLLHRLGLLRRAAVSYQMALSFAPDEACRATVSDYKKYCLDEISEKERSLAVHVVGSPSGEAVSLVNHLLGSYHDMKAGADEAAVLLYFDLSDHLSFRETVRGGRRSAYIPCSSFFRLGVTEIERILGMDVVFLLSKFQADLFCKTYPFPAGRIKALPAAFDERPFLAEQRKDGYRIAYTMAPGPGLEVAREIVELVKVEVPEAELVVAGHAERHAAMMGAKIWLYPALVDEVFCPSVLEAQAAGCVPIVSSNGCLPELVQQGFVYKPPFTALFNQTAARRIVFLLRNEEDRLQLAVDARRRVMAENASAMVSGLWSEALCDLAIW
jgi:tetratricopeptide (TPR) repeat protein